MIEAFESQELLSRRQATGQLYLEFLRHSSMSVGLYVLPANGVDSQSPHSEDEAYYVLSGQGTITVAGEDRSVQPGSFIFVGAGVEHRFHTIREELSLLVFFAPAEYTNKS